MASASPFDYPDFRRWLVVRFLVVLGAQLEVLAVGWHIYALTGRPMALAYAGLAQFLPVFFLALVTGSVADRFDRRRILAASYVLQGSVAAGFALHAYTRSTSTAWLYGLAFSIGVLRSFANPAASALVASLVEAPALPRAIAISTTVWQAVTIAGLSAGGFLIASLGTTGTFAFAAVLPFVGAVIVLTLKPRARLVPSKAISWSSILAGVRYVRENRVVLGCISLDLFAVLLGGATALLPIFARDLLKVDAWGFGLLRAAPGVGAVAVAVWLGTRPIQRHVGPKMLAAVAVFGLATVAFGLSRNLWISIAALVTLGGADMVSVVVRQTLVQVLTPDEMRGRVGAVNQVFVGASNELGEFESGAVAALIGAGPAAIVGGLGTLVVVVVWAFLFPQVREVDRIVAGGETDK
jgi:MFS family permease